MLLTAPPAVTAPEVLYTAAASLYYMYNYGDELVRE